MLWRAGAFHVGGAAIADKRMRWRATNTRIVCAAAGHSGIRAQRRSAIRVCALAAFAPSLKRAHGVHAS